MNTASNLGTILNRLEVKQRAVAEALGIREEIVSRWVNGVHVPAGGNLVQLLAFLQRFDPSITLASLFEQPALPPAVGE